MLLVRLAYVADLPVPAELVKSIASGEPIARAIPEASVAAPQPDRGDATARGGCGR